MQAIDLEFGGWGCIGEGDERMAADLRGRGGQRGSHPTADGCGGGADLESFLVPTANRAVETSPMHMVTRKVAAASPLRHYT